MQTLCTVVLIITSFLMAQMLPISKDNCLRQGAKCNEILDVDVDSRGVGGGGWLETL